jgi:hypothetical protein
MADYYDDYYVRNRACRCPRCAAHWLMGPAILVTVGVLFLIQQLGIMDFGRSFPILLIVIGVIKIAQRTAPDMGHVQPTPYYPPGQLGQQIRDDIRRSVEQNIARSVGVPPSGPTIEGNPPNPEVKRG